MNTKLLSGIAIGAFAVGGVGMANGVFDGDYSSSSSSHSSSSVSSSANPKSVSSSSTSTTSSTSRPNFDAIGTSEINSSDYRAEYSNKRSYEFDHTYDADCGSFESQSDAKIAYEESMKIFGLDRHFLDGDGNGEACESYDY